MKILIVGAGWYGCHIAKKMIGRGFDVTLVDKEESVFSGASLYNQNRLHQGFHYPRCSVTRRQSKRGFHLFKKEYPSLVKPIDFNLYAVAENKSSMDFDTYHTIMKSEGVNFEDISTVSPVELKNVAGVLDCEEGYICPYSSKLFFGKELAHCFQKNVKLNCEALKSACEEFDYVIDCTWGANLSGVDDSVYYESCLYHVYNSCFFENMAITIMDGEFFSIFPYGKSRYTVTSVKDIKIGEFSTYEEACAFNRSLDLSSDPRVDENKKNVEDLIGRFMPAFQSCFSYERSLLSIKTKFRSGSDSRFAKIYTDGNLISVLSGKIDTIFDADSMVMNYIRGRI